MDIAYQADGCMDTTHILLLYEDIFEPVAQDADCLLFQQFTVQGSLDEAVDVKWHSKTALLSILNYNNKYSLKVSHFSLPKRSFLVI